MADESPKKITQEPQDDGSQNGADGESHHHRIEAKAYFFIFLWVFADFLIGLGHVHLAVWCFGIVLWLVMTVTTYHAQKGWPRLGKHLWVMHIGVCLAIPIILWCLSRSNQTPETQTAPGPIQALAWQPPELPPGCSNVSVSFGTMRIDVPIWVAKMPHKVSDTNLYGTNVFTTQITSNIALTVYHGGDIETNKEAIKYLVKDLPSSFVSNAEKSPDYSPRKRHMSFTSQFWRAQMPTGKIIDTPVWPFVVSNRLYVDVEIPFINQRRRILMDTNMDSELTNLPRLWDINYDSNKFEVVNENTNPVLQVMYKSPNEVQVNGIYIVDNIDVYAAFNSAPLWMYEVIVAVSQQSTQLMELEDFEKHATNMVFRVDTNSVFKADFSNTRPIFKYPSWKYLGELAP